MKSIGSEIAFVAWTLSIPCSIALVFPYDAFEFKASRGDMGKVESSMIITLSPELEKHAISLAKTSWKGEMYRLDRPRANLMISDLPTDERLPVMPFESRSPRERNCLVEMPAPPYLPSCAAKPPQKLGNDGELQVFGKTELLKLN